MQTSWRPLGPAGRGMFRTASWAGRVLAAGEEAGQVLEDGVSAGVALLPDFPQQHNAIVDSLD